MTRLLIVLLFAALAAAHSWAEYENIEKQTNPYSYQHLMHTPILPWID